jgi:hypothetical protein
MLILGAPIMFGACAQAPTFATTQGANTPSVLRPSDVVGELEPTRAVIASTNSSIDSTRDTSAKAILRAPSSASQYESASEPVGGRSAVASHGLELVPHAHFPVPCAVCR